MEVAGAGERQGRGEGRVALDDVVPLVTMTPCGGCGRRGDLLGEGAGDAEHQQDESETGDTHDDSVDAKQLHLNGGRARAPEQVGYI